MATRSPKADGFERQEHGEHTRRRILDAAIALFADRGYRGTGVAALAKEVEMSGPGLLYYFGSKEGLLREVVGERERVEQVERQSRVRLRDLRASGRRTTRNATLAKLFVVLGAEAIHPDHPLHTYFVERYRRQHRTAQRILDIERTEGRAPTSTDTEQLAVEMQAMTLGLTMLWLTDPTTFDYRQRIEQYYERVQTELQRVNSTAATTETTGPTTDPDGAS